jgi:nitrogen fixation protein
MRLIKREFRFVFGVLAAVLVFPTIGLAQGRGPEKPVVSNRKGAGVDVTFRNGCRISYDREIRQIGSNGRCNRGQYPRAANAASDYYRRQGPRRGPERPVVSNRKGAGVDVTFRNGCRISYDRYIRQIGSNGRCNRGQYPRAANAARDYYRRH